MEKINRMKIGIVGAGLGGLAAGAMLSEKGYKVEIFEKEEILGGRALTLDGNKLTLDEYKNILHRFDTWIPFSEPDLNTIFEEKMLHGYRIDLGFHLLGFIERSPLLKILERSGEKVDMSSSRFSFVNPEKGTVNALSSYLTIADILRLIPLISRFFFARRLTLLKMQEVPISETLDRYFTGKLGNAFGTGAKLITTVNNLDKISTGETLRVLAHWIRGAKPTGYPRKGLITLSEAFANIIMKNRGEITVNKKVKKILIEDDKAYGIEVRGEERDYDVILSNLPVQDLFTLASEENFPPHYVKKMKDIEGTGSVCAYYSLKKVNSHLIGRPFAFVETGIDVEGKDAAGVIDFQTADPINGLSPKGRYLVQGYIVCSPKEARDKKKVSRLREVLDKKLEELIPDFRKNLVFALYPTTWHLDGVAKIIGNEKPESVTPIRNLYLVGDCVKSTGIGMNCAVDSAISLSEEL